MLSPSWKKSPSGSHHHPGEVGNYASHQTAFFNNLFPLPERRQMKLYSVLNKKNTGTTNHPFTQKELLLNNNDYSVDAQNFKYQNTFFNNDTKEKNVWSYLSPRHCKHLILVNFALKISIPPLKPSLILQ